ncbi:MAG TPA: hypothetical protein VL284_02685 [Thermoanaerobaculia bacterium]|nr:hypothetical protein [Thermoanaerobaculia bacterium]
MVVLLRLAGAALRRGADRFVLARLAVDFFAAAFFPPRRAAFREGARFDDAFFDERERLEEDFVERFLEEDRLRDAMGFLLFSDLQSGLM